MFDRQKLIRGISFVGIGIAVLIVAMWIEPLLNVNGLNGLYQWIILLIRIIALVCIVVGIIYSIISLIPK